MCMHAPVCVCMLEVCVPKLENACADVCMRMHALGSMWSFFFKNSLSSPKISYIFHKHFP